MVAYVVVIRERTINPSEDETYTPKAGAASAGHPLTIRALHGRHEVLEGPAIDALSILEFPTFESAQAWYNKSRVPGGACPSAAGRGVPLRDRAGSLMGSGAPLIRSPAVRAGRQCAHESMNRPSP